MADFPAERPVFLLGESFGGILALAVAAGRPDLCDRIVLVSNLHLACILPWRIVAHVMSPVMSPACCRGACLLRGQRSCTMIQAAHNR